MTGLIDLATNFGLAAIVLAWTVQGVLDIRSQGLRRKPVLKCVGAVAIYVALVGAWYYMHVITTDLVTRMDSFPAASITGGWGRELPADKRGNRVTGTRFSIWTAVAGHLGTGNSV